MQDVNKENKNGIIQSQVEDLKPESEAITPAAPKKKGFSLALFVKLLAVSILIIGISQIYLFDSANNGLNSGLGGLISKITPGNANLDNALSNSEIESIIKSMVPASTTVSIQNVVKEGDFYKMTVSFSGQGGSQDLEGMLSADGKKFYSQIDVEEAKKQASAANNTDDTDNTPKEISKSDKPKVELFVMSHCPYGTQIEKGMIPVAELLKGKIDFSIKFVDYAMHGEKEVYEQLNQYCIQKEQSDKYFSYLKCFLKDGNSDSCLKNAGISASKLTSCTKAADSQFKISEKLKDQSTWSGGRFPSFDIYKTENVQYGVQGSPTLVINGAIASSGRDSKSLLSKVCSAFTSQPSECGQSLSSTQPAPGFGDGAAANQNSASCGN